MNRVLWVRLKMNTFNMSITVSYSSSSEMTKEKIDSRLENAKTQRKSKEIIFMMGYMHANIGKEQDSEMAAMYELESWNKYGEE